MTRLLVCVLLFGLLQAAEPTGTLAGTILDPAGAVVPAAKVSVVNTQTGLKREMPSSTDGSFVFPLLPVGGYKLSVEAGGFGRYEQTGIQLGADQSATLSIRLQLGTTSQSVEVSAAAAMVETRSGALSQVVNQQKITELPLDGRNAASLVLLAPGAVDLRAGNSRGSGDTLQTISSPSAVSISANGGRADTANYSLDGGSNQDTYTNVNNPFPNPDAVEEFSVQTNSFSAEYGRGSGAIVNVVTKSGTNQFHGSLFEFLRNGDMNARNFFASEHDLLKRNQFGGSVGGPIIRNKLFFFGTYQGTQLRDVQSGLSATVYTAAQRQGDFSSLSRQIVDPVTKVPFAGNRIPVSRFDPAGASLLTHLPVASSADGLVYFQRPDNEHENQFMGRVDYLVGSHRLYARYFDNTYKKDAVSDGAYLLTSGRGVDLPTKTTSFNDTMSLGPTLLNSFIASYTRNSSAVLSGAPFDYSALGIKNVATTNPAELVIAVSGYFSINTGHPGTFARDTFQLADSLHWIKGKHEIAVGGDYLRSRFDGTNTYRQNGQYRFRGTSYSGNPLTDTLLGFADRFIQGGGEYQTRRGNMASLFIQDNYRVRRDLTLSFGLRWDPFYPFTEKDGKVECFAPGSKSSRFVNAPSGYLYAGDAGCPQGGFDSRTAQFAPRVGLSYNPDGGKTVIRAGAGLFYQPPFLEAFNNMSDSAPFSPQVQLFRVPFSNPYASATNPFPAQFAPTVPGANVAFDLPMSLAVSYSRDWRPSRVLNWNFTVERQLTTDLLARISYVGSKGTHLNYNTDINAPLPSPTATADNEDDRRPYSQFLQFTQNIAGANSSFNALQLSLEKRFSRGFTLSANYTWGKSMDPMSYATDLDGINVINPYNVNAYRAVSDYNVPHRFVLNSLWQLPSPSGGVAKLVLGNWQASGIFSWQSGFPLNFSTANDTSFSLPTVGDDQAQLSCSPQYTGGSRGDRIASWFQTKCFGIPQDNSFGNAGRNIMIGPGTVNLDFGAHKSFRITEKSQLQFRAEFFNLFNHPLLENPDTTVGDTNFGRILGARSPRTAQLALRFNF
ncbi:TonB-dependent receptor [Paludibaculum fermentans]|uniref:TonB-dependent receptor n=1 Tax=Paludibaculum fermentans TaxID=1473598 RepID=A0A7S7NP99_PALFE|nr:carboxypeptidase regulatory-like domain-containing protein [Paludibaculum fermentans]QOY87286.1 TonB-dependent receptor [Paludibaculum fermentans]